MSGKNPNTLQPPEYYMPLLNALREKNPLARRWKLRVEHHENRHPESNGHAWGWYEVHPLGITVGYWGSEGNSLLKADMLAWNTEAETK
jgi:hypothetical protein